MRVLTSIKPREINRSESGQRSKRQSPVITIVAEMDSLFVHSFSGMSVFERKYHYSQDV